MVEINNDLFIKIKYKSDKWINKNYPLIFSFIETNYNARTWKEKLYMHLNHMVDIPLCYCGKQVVFKYIGDGYTLFCSFSCSNKSLLKKEKRLNSFLKSSGIVNNLIKKQNKYLDKCNIIHNNKYDYTKTIYRGIRLKIVIICPIHGEFEMRADCHLKKGCPSCSIEKRTIKIITSERLATLQKTHNNYYIYNDLNIYDNHKINITCPKHGIFTQTIHAHEVGRICKKCSNDKIREAKSKGIKYMSINKATIKYSEKRKEKHLDRLANDHLYKVTISVRNLIRGAMLRGGYTKRSKTQDILGCTYNDFKIHLEKLFLPNMTWDNKAEWHIDHIIPISFAETEDEVIMLNHYSNLSPLWSIDNLSKGDTITIKTDLYYKILEKRNGTL